MPYLLVLLTAALAQSPDIATLRDGIDKAFSRMNDFSADFEQIFQSSSNPKHSVRGHVYLKRGQKMRFDYKSPEESQWVSDGKTVYEYTPAAGQVNQYPVKESDSEHIPMMFLLGREGLSKEFKEIGKLIEAPLVAGNVVLRLMPHKKDLPVVVVEVDPRTYWINHLILVHPGGERTEYVFRNIKVNSGLASSVFEFTPPPGVAVRKENR